ncbi:MAG: hypothetical protein U1E25_07355 [Methylocystis sp.]
MSGRGLSQTSKRIIEAAYHVLETEHPASVRAVCYRLFACGVIDSMKKGETDKVSRLLVYARENEIIPWEWIVDETRETEIISAWSDPEDYFKTVARAFRKDLWQTQDERVLIVSEKGTVRGTLQPVIDRFAVPFLVMHGFGSATAIHDLAEQTTFADRPLNILYVGDWDPSGLYMSEEDLPRRLERYDADNYDLRRIALIENDLRGLSSFDAATKSGDRRHKWFVSNFGNQCYELDAMAPSALRARVELEICQHIAWQPWERAEKVAKVEAESIRIIDWKGLFSGKPKNTDGGAQ